MALHTLVVVGIHPGHDKILTSFFMTRRALSILTRVVFHIDWFVTIAAALQVEIKHLAMTFRTTGVGGLGYTGHILVPNLFVAR